MASRSRFVSLMAVLLALVVSGAAAFPVDPGGEAPAFELPSFDGGAALRSEGIFPEHDLTFLVFWRSSCPHCVESLAACERFHRRYGGESVAVVGIHADEGDRLAARGAAESSGATFRQAHDPGGMTTARYGVPHGTFAVYLVGRDSRVIDARIDPQGDIDAAMYAMLASPAAAEAPATGEPASPGGTAATKGTAAFSYHGTQRIRFLSIDSRGTDPAGLYGEAVSSRNSLQYRLQVEAAKELTRHLRVGGLLRISNEGNDVLDAGPQYLGSEWGSAFAEASGLGASLRLGYYSLSMTPLTLMRWDWDDNPRVGGDAGCGCGAAAGALLVESLEELGPELTFEGAMLSYGRSGVEARAFYGIPRRALETAYSSYRSGAGEHARYSLELYGFETRWQRLDGRTGSFWKAGVHVLGTAEDERSVDFPALGYYFPDPWESTWIVSAAAEAPLVRYARLRGELAAWKWREEGIASGEDVLSDSRDGLAAEGGIVIEKPDAFDIRLDYLRLDPNFVSPFAALSYESNTEGLRASARVETPGGIVTLSLFHKRLRELEVPAAGAERERIAISGASVDFKIAESMGADLGWLEKSARRGGTVSPSHEYRRAIAAGLHYDFGRIGVLRAQYQRVGVSGASLEYGTEGETDLYSLYTTAYF